MVRISSGLDGYNDETRLWFDRTVAAEADFQPAYKNLLWFMRPRWGGGHEEMYQFGVQCLRTKRFDTEVPLWFVKALVEITDDLEDDKEYWLRPETTKHLRTLFEGYTNSKDLTEAEKQRIRLLQAGAEWYLENYKEARTLFDTVKWEGGATEFEYFYEVNPQIARGESYLFSGETAEVALAAQESFEQELWEEAAEAYARVLADASLPGPAKAVAQERLEKAQWQVDFENGKWVALQPKSSFSGWDIEDGSWSVNEDGSLVGVPGENGAWLLCLTDIGSRVELRGIVELVPGANSENTQAGIYFRWVDSEQDNLLVYKLNQSDQQAILFAEVKKRETHLATTVIEKQNSLLFSLWDNKASAWVNGKPTHKQIRLWPNKVNGRVFVGIGNTLGPAGAITRFRNLEVRRLTSEPK
jgi:hypothetical protein